MKFIILANGDSKPIEFYFDDGIHYICPWCGYPTTTDCRNPGCWTAFKDVEALQVALNKEAERLAANAERQRFLEIRNNSYGKRKSN